ncbi:MAG: hypothetical protein K0S65_1360 [Labilithrix sp.]|nr:hypothetical protein [Labilithrix sp.]
MARIRSIAASSAIGLALLGSLSQCGADRAAFSEPPGFGRTEDAGECPFQCSFDGRSVIRSCTGEIVETCPPQLACGAALCQEPCAAAAADRSSNGCEFYFQPPAATEEYPDSCYASFVVNTSTQPVSLELERDGEVLDVSKAMFSTHPGDATLIEHTGPIGAGESVILFVADHDPKTRPTGGNYVACPADVVPAFRWGRFLRTTGIGSSFHLKASAPVSLVGMYPFGGAESFIPSTTLLLPIATWGLQHVVVDPWESTLSGNPNTQILAAEDDTEVKILPSRAIQNGVGVEGAPAKIPVTYRLDKGQYLQFVQFEELSGSIVVSDKPTTVFGGHGCAFIPTNEGPCDTLNQQLPAFEQWGSEYVGVGYRPRLGDEHEAMPYRIAAARDGTRLDYDPSIPAGAPTELSAGEVVTFPAGTGEPFVVRTQDADHPIYLAAYMTSSSGSYFGSPPSNGWGDPEFVNVVPAGQYLNSYSFYADPTYHETSLVVVRAKARGAFKDVWLECAGNLTDFRPIGTRGEYEFTRVDLSRNRGPGQQFGDKTCRSGLQRMRSEGPFTATLWGWSFASSYAYPGGMAHRKLVATPLAAIH